MSYKWWVIIAVCLFAIGMVLGLTVLGSADSTFLPEELEAFEQFAGMLTPFTVTMVAVIFVKNVTVLLLSFMFSPFLCLLPAGALLLNGGLLSFVSAIIIQEKSLGFLLAGVLPHGIFEIPAIIIGEAAALSFGFAVIMLLVRKESWAALVSFAQQSFWHILLTFFLILTTGIFPVVIVMALFTDETRSIFIPKLKQNLRYLAIACALLAPAAVIETYATPLLLY